ncbi:MAG: GNAT family N-acetyltransferase [Nanoarchaeota archaeon]|nr:GNAT family N-acetyltransferase [Nanoarchaeota archaeon]
MDKLLALEIAVNYKYSKRNPVYMLNRKLYSILSSDKDLGILLHSHYIYVSDKNNQIKARDIVHNLIQEYEDPKFLELGYSQNTKELIREFISCKNEPNWKKVLNKFLKGLLELLEREIIKAHPINIPKNISQLINLEIKKIPMYNKSAIINITESTKGIFAVSLLNKDYSPDYNPKILSNHGVWEYWRDTQLVFILNFNKDLFIWDYINVHKEFQGKRLGTKSAIMVEKIAEEIGFTRFTIEHPYRQYWTKVMNYNIPYRYRIGSGRCQYTLEGYKEL